MCYSLLCCYLAFWKRLEHWHNYLNIWLAWLLTTISPTSTCIVNNISKLDTKKYFPAFHFVWCWQYTICIHPKINTCQLPVYAFNQSEKCTKVILLLRGYVPIKSMILSVWPWSINVFRLICKSPLVDNYFIRQNYAEVLLLTLQTSELRVTRKHLSRSIALFSLCMSITLFG